ncbi:MAG: MFS transporter [Elusimicrobiaceae bacterium]|nr:MFS transporter [Elusimicrobiaceae bacterium]
MNMKLRLIVMNFLQFAVWGAYLTSMGAFLANVGLAQYIGLFYASQGFVSIFMPAVIGILADRWIPAQKMLGLCHFLAAVFMAAAAYFGSLPEVSFKVIYTCYLLSVAFYMPTLGVSNSVAYTSLHKVNLDPVTAFPPIRIWGTIGFICTMLVSNFTGFQNTFAQWYLSAGLGLLLAVYSFTLPECPVAKAGEKKSLAEAMGLKAFALFKDKKMAIFFIFSILLGSCLQITNGYANPFIHSYNSLQGLAGSWGASNANALISLSQVSETFCILLIPFFLKRFGIKKVMLISMFAWVLRFGLFGLGNPVSFGGITLLVLSMIVYGVAFDFFNVSGSLFVEKETDESIRSSAQGLFILMTNGVGATIGMLGAQKVIDRFVNAPTNAFIEANGPLAQGALYPAEVSQAIASGWANSWFVFAAYALVIAIAFAFIFKYKHNPQEN